MEKKLLLAPSMGCCDLYDFEHQVRCIDEKADFLHIDIKDGNYVKTFGVGPDFMTVLGKVVHTSRLALKREQPISPPIRTVLRAMRLSRLTRSFPWAARRESQ